MPPLQRARLIRTPRRSRASEGVTSEGDPAAGAGVARPSGIGEAVPLAANGLDEPAGRPELVAQVVDVRIDRVRGHRDAEGPSLVKQLVAREGLAGVPQQAFEQRELARAEVDACAFYRHAARRLIERDRP